jgi:hypothetical protein
MMMIMNLYDEVLHELHFRFNPWWL